MSEQANERAAQAVALLESVKGIAAARVDVDERGRFVRVCVQPESVEDRACARNAQSALYAQFGELLDVNEIVIGNIDVARAAPPAPTPVLALHVPRRDDLNEAARVAFDTLQAAQASFHGFQFDGAELVRISGMQYVVVAVRRALTDAHYCGAAPVLDGVGTASARALLNAVGMAAMGAPSVEWTHSGQLEKLNA